MRNFRVVALTEDMPKLRLSRGQVGTVVMSLDGKHAEVEFADLGGQPYTQATPLTSKLLELHHAPFVEARANERYQST